MEKLMVLFVAILTLLISWLPSSESCWAADDANNNNTEFHLKIHKVSHYSFFPGNPRWPKYTLTYSFPQGFPANGISAVDKAFSQWASRTPFRFTKVTGNSDLKISFQRGNHGDGAPFDGRGGILAHAFSPQNGWLHFDGDELYSNGAMAGYFDLISVAVHEIGHLLGLGHSNVQSAVMFPSISSGTSKAIPQPDDLNGLRALYGYY